MKCFVMRTSLYEEESKKYNCTQVINRFQHEVEAYEDYNHPNDLNYGFGNYLRKRHGNFRTVLTYKNFRIDGKDVRCYVALRVFTRGEKSYEEFYAKNISDDKRERIVGMKYVNWEELEKAVTEKLKEPDNTVILPVLTLNENNYIKRGCGITHEIFDTKVIESKYWIETTRATCFNDPMKVVDALIKLIEEGNCYGKYGFIEESYGEVGKKILCARPDTGCGDLWYLLKIGNDEEIAEFKLNHHLGDVPNVEMLNEMSVRAYPFSMLEGDKDFWWAMEKDENSNFILSYEELDIVSKEIKFPLFLTGRAGSGKSTMLQYLFAEYFLRYLEYSDVNPPVYISYSANLIDNAKKLATNLYTKNHAYIKKLNELHKTFEEDIQPNFDSSFHVFQQLVKKIIDEKVPGVVQKRFSQNKHITYTKFRDEWIKKFNKNPNAKDKFGPAISWHIIRTYIKGWNAEEYLTPELYSSIGKFNKSVSDDVFKIVYDEVWENWYSKLQDEDSVWDDQDLVRYCLAPDDDSCETCVTDRFGAIFCDESQDFTRTEIDFILRISSFSKRRVYDENTLYQLPFVFAGDEFQTLNPTGFSWNSLRSYFTTQLMRVTMAKAVGAPDPVVLTHNYRSPAAITKLANRLQLLRHTRCGNDEKYTPQIPYHCQEKPDPVLCLSPNNPLVWKKLSSMGTVLIIPCSEGQSPKEFIEKSGIREHFDFYEDGSSKDITIYNPAQAKGLEYPNVAIYGFDNFKDLSIHNLYTWYNSDKPDPDSESKEIEMKYFLSNAYVSATRASNKLFILSDFNDESFWAFAFSSEDSKLQDTISSVGKQMINHAKWDCDYSLLGYIVKGDVDDITNDSFLNIGELAISTKERAMELSDASLMRQAAARYREQNNEQEVYICEAYAYRFDNDHKSAALSFEKIQDYANALDDYWNIDGDDKDTVKEIVQYISKLSGKVSDLRVTLSEHALKKRVTLNEFKMDLYSLKEQLEKNAEKLLDNLNSDIWTSVLNLILLNIPLTGSVNKNDLDPILNIADELDKKYYIEINKNILALMAFKADEFRRAVDIWGTIKVRPKEFYQAQCRLLKYPANVVYREQTQDPEWMNYVIEDSRANKNIKLENYQEKIVSKSFVAKGTKDEIKDNLVYLWSQASELKEAKEYGNLAKQNKFSYAEECIDALFLYRWGNTDKIQLTRNNYISRELNLLMQVLNKIKEIRKPAFLEKINKAVKLRQEHYDDYLENKNKSFTNDFINFLDDEFKAFKWVKWNCLILYELGDIMEKRNFFLDAQRFYEWAENQTNDYNLKYDIGVRWIICRFNQAKLETDPEKYQRILERAEFKMRELNVSFNPKDEYPQEFKFDRWSFIYKAVLELPSDKQTPKKRQENKLSVKKDLVTAIGSDDIVVEKEDKFNFSDKSLLKKRGEEQSFKYNNIGNNVEHVTPVDDRNNTNSKVAAVVSGLENKYFDYVIKNYKFRYNPMKNELCIKLQTNDEDLSVKIKQGIFPDDSDFMVNDDGILLKTENKVATPFKYSKEEKAVKIIDVESGMEIKFPIN